jgi:glycosyltransferase involved in cell wall biosynthesis
MTTIAFIWDNFGPMHDDRVRAVVKAYEGQARIVGIELFGKSDTYAWDNEANTEFEKVTLFPGMEGWSVPSLSVAARIVRRCWQLKVDHIFLCNYDQTAILLAATALRLTGRGVYTMACSKFDDLERNLTREFLKRFFFLPYHGAISSGLRARDYMRLMGIPRNRIASEYNTLSIDRIRALSGALPAPHGTGFADRHFTIVARFVPKKNLTMALDAYAHYCGTTAHPRPLHLCGSGKLEASLRTQVAALRLEDLVVFRGFLQSDGVAQALGNSLALVLPSVEEQFGNVVIEAQAMGLPVILSDNCGARDKLVRAGVNGFVIEPDNPEGLAFFMGLLDRDEALWRRMSISAGSSAKKGDVARFAEAVQMLVSAERNVT